MRWMTYTMTSVYMWWNDTVKWVRRFKMPAKANHTSRLVGAYSQTLCTWVGRTAGGWNGCGWYSGNKCKMEVRKPGQKSQRSDENGKYSSRNNISALRKQTPLVLTPCSDSTSLPVPSHVCMKFLKNFILTTRSRIRRRPIPLKVNSTGRPDAIHLDSAPRTSRMHVSIVSRLKAFGFSIESCAKLSGTTGRPPEDWKKSG